MASVKKLLQWQEEFTSTHAQPLDTTAGDFLSSESVVLLSGPPKLADGSPLELIPVGLVQNTQVTQAKQIQQLFEIGSRLPFFIPGRTTIQVGMARVLFDGPSLMQALYAYTGPDGSNIYVPGIGAGTSATSDPGAPFNEDGENDGTPVQIGTFTGGFDTTNTTEFFINLASEFFNKPLGLGCVLFDMQQQAYGGFYLEECYIQSHRFSASSQQTVLMEDVGIRCTALRPISIDELGGV